MDDLIPVEFATCQEFQVWSMTQPFRLLLTIPDQCKKVRFQQTLNQGFCQLLLTGSWDLSD